MVALTRYNYRLTSIRLSMKRLRVLGLSKIDKASSPRATPSSRDAGGNS